MKAIVWARPCYVYLIAVESPASVVAELYKVGISADPVSRLGSLATASPFPLRLVGSWRYPSREVAYQVEQQFHRDYARYRINLEWFDGPLCGAWGELDSAALLYLVETCGWRVDEAHGALRHIGVRDDMIDDLVLSHYGAPPYDWVCAQ